VPRLCGRVVSLYAAGRRLSGDLSHRPFFDWVAYGEDLEPTGPDSPRRQFSACYIDGAFLYRDAEGWWRYDWAHFHFRELPPRLRVNQAAVVRAWACRPRGWALLPVQWDLP
jgi:DNA-binding transcriptional LysR family regulator